jgi:hypothetical protein
MEEHGLEISRLSNYVCLPYACFHDGANAGGKIRMHLLISLNLRMRLL